MRLPVIPLGVDCDADASGTGTGAPGSGSGQGRELRDRLGIAADDIVVLFVGRLSFHGKAHPTPMYMAAAHAAERIEDRTTHLLLAGQFPNRATEKEFREAATRFCGGARAHFVDGSAGPRGPAIRAAMQAADLFVSLSDNVQETFGLTPVEAMAAGLPCVVSDWSGHGRPDGKAGGGRTDASDGSDRRAPGRRAQAGANAAVAREIRSGGVRSGPGSTLSSTRIRPTRTARLIAFPHPSQPSTSPSTTASSSRARCGTSFAAA